MSEIKKFNEVFDYLCDPVMPDKAYPVLVFGRHDTRLIDTMKGLRDNGLGDSFVISGGLGKDSGYLHDLEIPEAKFLVSVATAQPYGFSPDRIRYEVEAKNGGDNARYGLAEMDDWGLDTTVVTALAHATSLRRLAATLENEGRKSDPVTSIVFRVGTNYAFNPESPVDQYEAAAEFMRLVEWPAKGWLGEQPNLPQNLIEFASDTRAAFDEQGPPTAYQTPTT